MDSVGSGEPIQTLKDSPPAMKTKKPTGDKIFQKKK